MGEHTADSISSTWVLLVLVFGCCVTAIAAASAAAQDHNIRIQCGYTRFPRLCVRTLSGGDDDQRVDFPALLLNKTIAHADLHVADFDELSSNLLSSQAQPALQAIGEPQMCFYNHPKKNVFCVKLKLIVRICVHNYMLKFSIVARLICRLL